MLNEYLTLLGNSETEQEIKKSRFIGRAFPVQSEKEALLVIERLKKAHWDATHNCYAYIVGKEQRVERYSDDGEPSGTAGTPMLDVLKKRGLTDALVVVTRYFGGVLLGAGGLVRAYSGGASRAVDEAGIARMERCGLYAIECDYALWGRLESFLASAGFETVGVEFSSIVAARAAVPAEREGWFLKQLADLSSGKLSPNRVDEQFRAFRC